MPGFNIGIGGDPGQPSNTIEVRRQHRWKFEALGRGTGSWSQTELLMLQSAQRPNIEFGLVEMHHNQEVAYFAGKQTWQPVTLVWYDSEQDPDISRSLYHWIETVVDMVSINVAHPSNYKKQGSLTMLDGGGNVTERWTMYGTWPVSCNWQDLNYTATELLTCEASMRYDRAVRDCVAPQSPVAVTPSCPATV